MEEGLVPKPGPVRRLLPSAADGAWRAREERRRARRRRPRRRLGQDDPGLLAGCHGRLTWPRRTSAAHLLNSPTPQERERGGGEARGRRRNRRGKGGAGGGEEIGPRKETTISSRNKGEEGGGGSFLPGCSTAACFRSLSLLPLAACDGGERSSPLT